MVLPSLFTPVGTEGTSGSTTMTAKDRVLFGAPDQDTFGFLSEPSVTCPCCASTQKAYCPGIALSLATPSSVTVRVAAMAVTGAKKTVVASAALQRPVHLDMRTLLFTSPDDRYQKRVRPPMARRAARARRRGTSFAL